MVDHNVGSSYHNIVQWSNGEYGEANIHTMENLTADNVNYILKNSQTFIILTK